MGKRDGMKTVAKRFQTSCKLFIELLEKSLHRENIKAVCTDMWTAYLHLINEKVTDAINVIGQFHIMQQKEKALDQDS